jgi:hypothetical protein
VKGRAAVHAVAIRAAQLKGLENFQHLLSVLFEIGPGQDLVVGDDV